MKKGQSEVEEFNLQSFWDEPGEDSYMRETVAFQVIFEVAVSSETHGSPDQRSTIESGAHRFICVLQNVLIPEL